MLRYMSLVGASVASSAFGASDAEKKAYPEFASQMEVYGYEWEARPVKTEDGWHLTIFRMIGYKGQ